MPPIKWELSSDLTSCMRVRTATHEPKTKKTVGAQILQLFPKCKRGQKRLLGKHCDKKKVEAIRNWKSPLKNVTEVSFVGSYQNFRKFAPHFSHIASLYMN